MIFCPNLQGYIKKIFLIYFENTVTMQENSCQGKSGSAGNSPGTGSSHPIASLYPSLASFSCHEQAKRGKGRFYQHNFKIPLHPPLPKGG
jgi:hypothetical protein